MTARATLAAVNVLEHFSGKLIIRHLEDEPSSRRSSPPSRTGNPSHNFCVAISGAGVANHMHLSVCHVATLVSMKAPGAAGKGCYCPWYAWKSLLLQAIKTTAIRRRTSFFIGPANPLAFELQEAMSELPWRRPESCGRLYLPYLQYIQ